MPVRLSLIHLALFTLKHKRKKYSYATVDTERFMNYRLTLSEL